MNARLRGRGVDIDAKLVKESNDQAKREGLADSVSFAHQNAFDVDLRDATVVTMWSFTELMRLLRPVILERARPGNCGSRPVRGRWAAGNQTRSVTMARQSTCGSSRTLVAVSLGLGSDAGGTTVSAGGCPGATFSKCGGRRPIGRSSVRFSKEWAWVARTSPSRCALPSMASDSLTTKSAGTVAGDEIKGSMKVTPLNQAPITLPWRARRTLRSDYYAPTGTATFRQSRIQKHLK